ncbi:MAG: VIT1/CCC1 transporter family protein, partial [Verrucomicrobiota bacterium]|nr:VIT1/CCC1 transporter family protein [Verrucomicrobiota bacterium]MDD8051940.1 VIT1/CCC1 transporter family protein [Verrucomicrobiota bacterium]
EIYQNKGYAKEEAEQLTELITRNKERWLDAMMVDELGMLPDESSPLLNGVATLVAFVLAGSVPLLVYFLGLVFPIAADLSFAIALGLSGVALFGLGVAKVLVTHLNPWKSGLEMLLVGGLAAFVAYLVGGMLKGLGAA